MKNYQQQVRSGKARYSQKVGRIGEDVMIHRLHAMGFIKAKKNATPMIKSRGKWIHTGSASVDITAMLPETGRHCHVEVKTYSEKLIHSVLRDNIADLDEYSKGPGLAFLAWLDKATMQSYVMPWPIAGFVKGTSLTPQIAARHAINRAEDAL